MVWTNGHAVRQGTMEERKGLAVTPWPVPCNAQSCRVPSALTCPHGLSFSGSGGYFRPQTAHIRLGGPPGSLS